MIFHWLNSVPYAQRVTLLVVIVGLVCSGFYTIVWTPAENEIEALTVKILHVEQEIERQMRRASELTDMEAKIQNLTSQGRSQVASLSPTTSPLHFRKNVMRLAGNYGILLTSWRPGGVKKNLKPEMRTWPMQGRLEGGYHEIAECLARILQLSWVLEIDQIRLSVLPGVGKKKPSLAADFQLVALPSGQQVDFISSIQN